jgi:hypothetical protein
MEPNDSPARSLKLCFGAAFDEWIHAGGDSDQDRMDLSGTVRTFVIGQVQSVIFSETSYQPPPPPQTADITILSETAVKIRMIDPVNSDTARQGDYIPSGDPEGADVVTKLVMDQQSGKIEGRTVGAAIGAGSGAAVGAEVLTSGQMVKIPSETRLTFRLQNPVQL